MATQRLTWPSKNVLPVSACDCVMLCLTTVGSGKTADGSGFLQAVIGNNHRNLGSGYVNPINSRGVDVIQYSLEIDDTLLATDPATQEPYIIECEDIVELNPYCCSIQELQGEQIPD